jgi:hypothetical protein
VRTPLGTSDGLSFDVAAQAPHDADVDLSVERRVLWSFDAGAAHFAAVIDDFTRAYALLSGGAAAPDGVPPV